jgi:hypothetical protein
MENHRVLRAVIAHPNAPRHISVPCLRDLYTFELAGLTLSPAVRLDVRTAAETAILARLPGMSLGERLALARRGSTRIDEALLLDARSDARVLQAALANPRLSEAALARALQSSRASEDLVRTVCRHDSWPLRRSIQIALVRSRHTPLARAVYVAGNLPAGILRELSEYVLPALRIELLKELKRRGTE